MPTLCVFAGTTEGRELVEFLNAQPCEVTACVATEYGQALLPEAERLTVSARRLPADEIKALLTDRHFDLVIDATHPYAASITKSIARACAETGVERWRLLRGASDAPEDAVFVESTEKAIVFLDQTEGNILLTTGSKELKAYSQIKDFAERVYARVLPLEDSLVLCREAGVKAAHILAMQGPFSEEMNTAMLRAIGAKWLVTKDGGAAGGFAELAAAAAKPGVLNRDEVDPADLDKEREILRAQALNDPKPKPANIIEKMVEGRIAKYYKEVCLLEQPFVKNPDQSIEQMLKEHGDVELVAFVRFEMGEGLQKRQDNFAEEVMGQMKK